MAAKEVLQGCVVLFCDGNAKRGCLQMHLANAHHRASALHDLEMGVKSLAYIVFGFLGNS